VLDSFEPVLGAAPFVADLLASCPGLTVPHCVCVLSMSWRYRRSAWQPTAQQPRSFLNACSPFVATSIYADRAHR
jgi:hypothetical protein